MTKEQFAEANEGLSDIYLQEVKKILMNYLEPKPEFTGITASEIARMICRKVGVIG